MTIEQPSRARIIAENIINGNHADARKLLRLASKLTVLDTVYELAFDAGIGTTEALHQVRELLVR